MTLTPEEIEYWAQEAISILRENGTTMHAEKLEAAIRQLQEQVKKERDEAIKVAAKHLEQLSNDELYERGLIKWYAKAATEICQLTKPPKATP